MRLIVVLSALHFLAFIDRTMIGGLLPLMRADIAMTDVQAGWIIGTAFALPYGITALAIAMTLRGRKASPGWIIGGALLWTGGSLATGLAGSLVELAAARVVLGVGQGVFVPIAISTLFAVAAPEAKGRALGLFMGSATAGRSTALLAVGLGLFMIASFAQDSGNEGWRWLFIVTALPNILVLLALAFTRTAASDRERADNRAAVDWLALLPLFFVAVAPVLLAQSVLAWLPSLFVNERGLSAETAALLIGTVTLFAAPAGPLIAGWLASRHRASEDYAPALVGVALAATLLPLAAMVWAPGLVAAVASLAVMLVTLGVASFCGLFAVQLMIPPTARVGVNGIYFAFMTAVGLGLGPLMTGALTSVTKGGTPLGSALIVTALIALAVCAIAIAAAQPAYRQRRPV